MFSYDVLIIGAGPAGSACAWGLKQHGVNCLLLDQQTFPRNKPCAGWLTPGVLEVLNLEPSSYPHSLTSFPRLYISLAGVPLIYPGRQYAIRRVEFDAWLLERSAAPFVQHHVKEIQAMEDGYVVDRTYFGKYLIGAGGTHCPIYHTFFKSATPRDEGERIVAMEQEFRYSWQDDRCRLWFFENDLPGYAWCVPKAGGYVNVGVGGSVDRIRAKENTIRTHWDHLVEKLDRLGLVRGHDYQPVSHVYYLHRERPQPRLGNAFLVGDAAGLATLDMGEGIGPAIQSGLLAADAILNGKDYDVASIPKYSLIPPFLGKMLLGG